MIKLKDLIETDIIYLEEVYLIFSYTDNRAYYENFKNFPLIMKF